MKIVLVAALAMMTGAANAADRFGETCRGTETVRVGDQPARTLPYALAFSADLAAGTYCTAGCGRDQSYAIADPRSQPIRLADLDRAGQIRHLTFDRASARLTDEQSFDPGLGKVVRHASATCTPAPFHAPAARP